MFKLANNKLLREKYPVIHKIWIYFCNIFFCAIREDQFLCEVFKQNLYYSHKFILELNIDRIQEFYSLDEKCISDFIDHIRSIYNN